MAVKSRKYFGEVADTIIAYLLGNLLHLHVRIGQQLFCSEHTNLCQILHKGCPDSFMKEGAQIIWGHMQLFGDLSNADIGCIVLLYKQNDLCYYVPGVLFWLDKQQLLATDLQLPLPLGNILPGGEPAGKCMTEKVRCSFL